MVHAILEALLHGKRFVRSGGYNHHFTGIHNSLNTNSHSHAGHLVRVATKETGVCQNGVVGQCLDARAAVQ